MKKSQRRCKTIQLIEPLEIRLLYSVHNDSFDVTDLTELRSTPAYSGITGSGITIAVLDTGVDDDNPDLTSKVLAFYNAVEDPIPSSISSSSVSSAVDNDGHGTHVSGIAASSDPDIGVADGADLVDVKVIADNGENELAGDPLLRGLEFVAEYASQFNIKVVNMSLGYSDSSRAGINENTTPAATDISREIKTLEGMGITVVAAAGNSYANDPVPGESFPAVVSTISVANVWSDDGSGYDFDNISYGDSGDLWGAEESSAQPDQIAASSQRGTLANQVAAPGMNVYSDWNGTSNDNTGSDLLHNTISGTSMAAPFVSGLVALMQQAAYTYGGRYITDPTEVLDIIKETSDVIQDPVSNYGDQRVPINGNDSGSDQALPGTGDTFDRVNVFAAIQKVQQLFTGVISNSPTNNTIASANQVPNLNGTADYTEEGDIGTDGLAQVGPQDVKLYAVVLDETGSLTAALSNTSGGTSFISTLRIFNASGGQIDIAIGTSSDPYPTIITSTISPLAEGTYYIGVSSAGNNAYNISDGSNATGGNTTGNYTLSLSLGNPDPNGVPAGADQVDLSDPNYENQQTAAVSNYFQGILGSDPPPTGSDIRVQVPNGDVDMFQVVAPDTGTLTADVDVSNYGFNGADSYLEIFDSNLNLIASNGQDTGEPSSSELQFAVTNGDTYYVAVTVAANANFSPTDPYTRLTNSTEDPTDYDLYLTFNNGNTDGTALLANQSTIGTTASGDIGSTNPLLGVNGGSKYVDWSTYTVNATGLLDLTATATSSGFAPSVSLWTETTNSSGDTVLQNIGGTSGSGESLYDSVTDGQVVYVSVTGEGNSNFNWESLGSGTGGETGTYTLSSSVLTSATDETTIASLNDNSVKNGTPGILTTGTPVTGNIGTDGGLIEGATDVDLYKFVAAVSGSYDIQTDTSAEGSAATYLRLFDASGNQLAANQNANDTTTSSLILANLVAGQTYYIGVSGVGNESYDALTGAGATAASSTGPYVLSVSAATLPSLTVNSPAAVDPATGATSITFTVALDAAAASAVTVNYTTADGTAVAGTNYTATSGTLTFEPGITSLTISVPLLTDASAIGTDTFSLDLTSPSSNAVIDGGQGTGTISNLVVTQLDFGGKKFATYTDSNGHKVVLELAGPGSGVASIFGTPTAEVEVALTGTTDKSRFTVVSSAAATTPISLLTVDGSLSSLNAPHTELEGNLTVSGSLALLRIAGATGSAALAIDGLGYGILELGNVIDLTINSAENLREITATDWTNTNNSDLIAAPSIGILSDRGLFGASLSLTDPNLVALKEARIGGAVIGGDWQINGSAGSIVAASTSLEWAADFQGSVTTLQINGTASGGITADSIGTLKVHGSFSDASITLTNAGTLKSPDLRTFVVTGTFSNSALRSVGDINSINLGAITGSTIDAGVSSTTTGLVAAASQFSSIAEIASFAITGEKGVTDLFTNSNISAGDLGKVIVQKVNTANAGTPFGFAAVSLASFTDAEPKTRTFRWVPKDGAGELAFSGDFEVTLV